MMSTIKADGQEIEISNPDKLMFADDGITKARLVEYYRKISEYILPHVENRPMMLHRYPDGIDGKDFYQKQVPDYFPDWIDTIKVRVKTEGKDEQELVNCNSQATLAYCANQASITPHVWLSTEKNLDRPDKMIYDLDPPEGDFEIVRKCARDLRELFDELELVAFLQTTGSAGVHVVLPLDGELDFNKVRKFAADVANLLAEREPDLYTVETLKAKRKKRLFLDYLRNAYGQTAVAPYSLRARKRAPVATPLDWDEIGSKDLTPQSYTLANIFRRLGNKEDPWKDFHKHANSLEKARDRLDNLM